MSAADLWAEFDVIMAHEELRPDDITITMFTERYEVSGKVALDKMRAYAREHPETHETIKIRGRNGGMWVLRRKTPA